MNVANIKIRPMIAYFGADVKQAGTITTVADVDSSLNNDYFLVRIAGALHYFWINVATTGTDPAVAGATGHAVAITEDASASAVATAVAGAMAALTTLFEAATASGSIVTYTLKTAGYQVPASEGVGTGFTFAISTYGDTALELGHLDGDLELSGLTPQFTDVTAHATGTTVLEKRVSGRESMELTIVLKETTKENLRRMLVDASGATHVPAGATATELIGMGSKTPCGGSLNGKYLRLHPVCNTALNKAEDYNFWKAAPVIDSLTWSGENIQTFPVTFQIQIDESKPEGINLWAYGDGSQVTA